jgi:two-component system, chemotaxis family, chemotaxis protein CheY
MQALVIDDSRAMRLILGKLLRELDFEVVEAENGRDALELIDADLDPALMLVDWNMPEMTGVEFVATVRKAPYDSRARILMITTETELPRVVEALEAGADEYLMKPFTREAVLDKLQLLGIEI